MTATFERRGGARIGMRRVSPPLATLRADLSTLAVETPIGSISFSPKEVVALDVVRGVAGLGRALRIVQTRDGRRVAFGCRDPEAVRSAILATGFVPWGRAGGGPDPERAAIRAAEDGRSRRTLVLIAGAGALAAALAFGGVVFGILAAFKDSDVYVASWRAVQASGDVAERLGTPLSSTTPSGSIDEVGAGGTARVIYRVTGPKGAADVQADATRVAGRWTIDRLTVVPTAIGAPTLDITHDVRATR